MKQLKHLIPVLALILALGFTALLSAPRASAATGDVKINSTNFPDNNFQFVVAGYDLNSDGVLSAAELKAITSLELSDNGINTLKGIEYLTSLSVLDCSRNSLTELNLSKNTKLTFLNCYHNKITSLDLSKNTLLESVSCEDNELTSLKLGSNTKLKDLYCCHNNLASLDVSKNTGLQYLDCSFNKYTSLDLSKNTKLIQIACSDSALTSLNLESNTALKSVKCDCNQMTSLNISKSTGLEYLVCDYNQLTSLDISKNTKLDYLNCSSNKLSSLNVTKNTKLECLDCSSNQLSSLDISKNPALTQLFCYDTRVVSLDISSNPALRAAYIAGEYSEENNVAWYVIDSDDSYYYDTIYFAVSSSISVVLNVPINETNFPDPNFRECVKSYDSDNNGYFNVSELKNATILDFTNKSICSLHGIECFSAALIIGCADNQLSELDVSLNPKLAWLVCNNNWLQSLTLGYKPTLVYLICNGNSIPVLDLRGAAHIAQAVEEGETDFSNPDYDIYAYKVSGSESALQVDKSAILLPNGNPFEDVKEEKFYYVPVMWAYTSNPQVTGGTSPWTFSPNESCSRAQVVTFLWRAKGCPEPKTTKNPFKDVKSDKYYYKAVLWAVENKITTGTSPTTFEPGKSCTRGEVVTFLWRSEGSPNPKTTKNPFTDVKSDKFYYKAVLWAVENKITTGTSTTTFEPGKTCTRGEVVTFLYRDIMGQ